MLTLLQMWLVLTVVAGASLLLVMGLQIVVRALRRLNVGWRDASPPVVAQEG